jgi:DNA-binding response OmpR family regulator
MASSVAAIEHRPSVSTAALPTRLKLLFVSSTEGAASWLTDAFAVDGVAQIVVEEAIGDSAGLARLRDEAFDAILIGHEPDALDAIELAAALRTGGHDEPVIIVGHDPPASLDALCYEAGADDYCCLAETTVRGLLWKFARAIQRSTLARENRRLIQAERQRLQQEHQEAERLLDQQRALIADLEELSEGARPACESLALAVDPNEPDESPTHEIAASMAPHHAIRLRQPSPPLPSELVAHYRDLLRAYVIMGAGNLSREMSALATLLADTNVSAQRAMQLHLQVLEELVQGLGNRSARHVMNRADLLALEVMSHLAEDYRQRYHERLHPAQQRLLPGFDCSAA